MKPQRLWFVLTVIIALGLVGYVGAQAKQASKARPTAVAVVDIESAVNKLAEKTQIEADMQSQADKLKAEKEKRDSDISKLRSDLEVLARGSANYNQKQAELDQKVIEYQSWAQYQELRLNRERALRIEDIYRKLTDAIGRTAKENGFDVVLFKENPEIKLPTARPEQTLTAIQVRKVLWSAEDLDLTDQVVTNMNNEYKNRTK